MKSQQQPVSRRSRTQNSWGDYHLRRPDAFLSSDTQLLVRLPTALVSAAIERSLPSFLPISLLPHQHSVSLLFTKMDYGSNDSKPRKLIAACLSYPFFLVHISASLCPTILPSRARHDARVQKNRISSRQLIHPWVSRTLIRLAAIVATRWIIIAAILFTARVDVIVVKRVWERMLY
ncbi:hypothetical protein DL96DRAFT_999174 [Flagelloscypha sp. PMI_526]|nr:hypothetical protein DL96DRAFT_999174 [Flagelloscypha sp. PMI_526]